MDDDVEMSPPHIARRKAARERILESAIRLLAASGWERTSIAEIAERAQVSVGTVYNRFGDRDALLLAAQFALLNAIRAELADVESSDPGLPFPLYLEETLRNVRTAFLRHRDAARVILIRATVDERVAARDEEMRRESEDWVVARLLEHHETGPRELAEPPIRFVISTIMRAELRLLTESTSEAGLADRAKRYSDLIVGYLRHCGALQAN